MGMTTTPPWTVNGERVNAVVVRSVVAARPGRVLRFGSQAWGDDDSQSDPDSMVVVVAGYLRPLMGLAQCLKPTPTRKPWQI